MCKGLPIVYGEPACPRSFARSHAAGLAVLGALAVAAALVQLHAAARGYAAFLAADERTNEPKLLEFEFHIGDRIPPMRPKGPGEDCVILLWTPWFGTSKLPMMLSLLPKCSTPCTISTNRSLSAEADVILFHVRDVNVKDIPTRRKHQPWILFTQEPWTYEFGYEEENGGTPFSKLIKQMPYFLDLFDFLGTPSLASDFPFPYHTILVSEPPGVYRAAKHLTAHFTLQHLTKPYGPSFTKPLRRHAVTTFLSNCYYDFSGRVPYIKELIQGFPAVHIRGRCMPTHFDSKAIPMKDILQEYQFVIAFENSHCADYVTEKFFRNGLQHGAVPIVDGPDTYREYAPNDLSYIMARDFATPKYLAKYIALLRADNELSMLHVAQRVDAKFMRKKFVERFLQPDGNVNSDKYFHCKIGSTIRSGNWPRIPAYGSLTEYFNEFRSYATSPCGINGNWGEIIEWQRRSGNDGLYLVIPPNTENALGDADSREQMFSRKGVSSRAHVPAKQLLVWNRLFLASQCVRIWDARPIRSADSPPRAVRTSVGVVSHAIDTKLVMSELEKTLDNFQEELFIHHDRVGIFSVWRKVWRGDFTLRDFDESKILLHDTSTDRKFEINAEKLENRFVVIEHCPFRWRGLGSTVVDSVARGNPRAR